MSAPAAKSRTKSQLATDWFALLGGSGGESSSSLAGSRNVRSDGDLNDS